MGYGQMLRIGLLVPSSNTTMEPDFYRMAPEGVSIHSARMMLDEVTPEGLVRMADYAERGAGLLSTADVNVIVYGCTTGSLVGGIKWEKDLVHRIQLKTGILSISTSGAVITALENLGASSIGVVTPYSDTLNMLEVKFLEAHGFEVTDIEGLGLLSNLLIGRTSAEVVLNLVDKVSKQVDVVFISCTNLPVIHIIEKIEGELGKTIVTSNQASFWAALREFGLSGFEGYGMLMKI
jgi:maleate isomerase